MWNVKFHEKSLFLKQHYSKYDNQAWLRVEKHVRNIGVQINRTNEIAVFIIRVDLRFGIFRDKVFP